MEDWFGGGRQTLPSTCPAISRQSRCVTYVSHLLQRSKLVGLSVSDSREKRGHGFCGARSRVSPEMRVSDFARSRRAKGAGGAAFGRSVSSGFKMATCCIQHGGYKNAASEVRRRR